VNDTLIEIIADFAVLMEFADDSQISPETAANALESMGWRLQKFDDTQRAEFKRAIRAVAERHPVQAEREFLLQLPAAAGLFDD